MSDTRSDVTIIGGGMTGLAAAYRLSARAPNLSLCLLEKEHRLGGKVRTESTPEGYLIEAGADSFLSRKPRGIGLCRELNLTERLIERDPAHPKTYVLRHGQLHPLPAGLTGLVPTDLSALEGSSLISAAGRARFEQEARIPALLLNGDESVAQFMTRRFGGEVFEQLIEPLMAGIYAGDARKQSLKATFPQLRQLELHHGSLTRGLQIAARERQPSGERDTYAPFVSFPGGMGEWVQALRSKIPPAALRQGVSATQLGRDPGGYRLRLSEGAAHRTKALILTTPAFVAAALLAEINPDLAALLAEIQHASTATVTLCFDVTDLPAPMYGYGYVIPQVEQADILACTWTSSKWPGRAPEGKVSIRIYLGRHGRRDVLEDRDRELIAVSRKEIAERLGITAQPELTRVFRYPRGSPQYLLGHPERLAQIEAQLPKTPGLFLAGASYKGVGIPDCIHSGETAAEEAACFCEA